MFKGLGDMAKLMQQAQQMQEKLAEAQARIEDMEAEGAAGAGMVSARVNGKGELRGVSIGPSMMTAEDREILEDLIVAAVNDAQDKARDMAQTEMAKITEGLPLPPGMKMPFG
jgi:DNA-binding YbaB/EbfC family protein